MRHPITLIIGLLTYYATAQVGQLRICGSNGSPELRTVYNESTVQGFALAGPKPKYQKVYVYMNIITATKADQAQYPQKMITEQIKVLNQAFYWGPLMKKSRFWFVLKGTTRRINKGWAHDHPADYYPNGSPMELQYKKKLRRGSYADLNIYALSDLHNGTLLGIGTFPSSRPSVWYDGVVMHADTMPGGSFDPYNQGKTLPHEVGHWLGLYHTFGANCNGGDVPCTCDGPGDYIDDTTTGKTVYRGDCTVSENSCPDHVGYDHINNYMNYGTDRCHMHFTPMQGERMRLLYGLRQK